MAAKKQIALFVRELRRKLGLTQEKFAAKLGVSFTTLNRWENGRTKPSPLAIQKLEDVAHELGTEGSELIKR